MTTCSKSHSRSSTSSALLFQNPTFSREASQIFVRKLVAVAISNLTYLRGLFPESVYADREFDGLELKILRGNEMCPAATQLVRWLSGAFDALQKNYLRKIIFGIHLEGNDEAVLESYCFTFTYTDDNVYTCHLVQNSSSSGSTLTLSKDTNYVRRCAMEMLRGTIDVAGKLDPLPENIMLSMKLLYYDQVTPEDYEPPGFIRAPDTSYNLDCCPLRVNFGEASTAYHSVSFYCRTDNSKFEAIKRLSLLAEESNISLGNDYGAEKQTPREDVSPGRQRQLQQEMAEVQPLEEYIPSSQIPKSPLCDPPQKSAEPATTSANPLLSSEPPVSDIKSASHHGELQSAAKCICGGNEKESILVLCEVCNFCSHAACYGFRLNALPKKFVCISCHNENKGQFCSDPKLLSLSPDVRKEICMYRRALVMSEGLTRVSAATLSREMEIERSMSDTLIDRLVSDKVVKKAKTKGASRAVNQNWLDTTLEQYFGPTATLGVKPMNRAMETSVKGIENIQLAPPTSIMDKPSLDKGIQQIHLSPQTSAMDGSSIDFVESSSSAEGPPPCKRKKISQATPSMLKVPL